jgi:hypothetical protein
MSVQFRRVIVPIADPRPRPIAGVRVTTVLSKWPSQFNNSNLTWHKIQQFIPVMQRSHASRRFPLCWGRTARGFDLLLDDISAPTSPDDALRDR